MLLGMFVVGGCGQSSKAPASDPQAATDPRDAATAKGLIRRAEEMVASALKKDDAAADHLGAVRGITIRGIQVYPRGYAAPFAAAENPPCFIIDGTMRFEHATTPVTVGVSRSGAAGDPSVEFLPIDWHVRHEILSVHVHFVDPQLSFANP